MHDQALPSAACSCFAKFKPLPGDRLPPGTGFMQYKHLPPLPQFGTVLKGPTNFRGPGGIAAVSVAEALQFNFSLCLILLLSILLQMLFLRIIPNKPPEHKFDSEYTSWGTRLTMGDKLLGGEDRRVFFSPHFALLCKFE